jgi:non-reducing end alpha-L-arabinofuranosidase
VVSAGGYVDTNALTQFCSGTTCGVSILYDQAGNGNDLSQATAIYQPVIQYWSLGNGMQLPMAVTVDRQYLRNRDKTSKIPVGAASQTEYFVIHGKYFNAKCCWDYGNMEAQVKSDGVATMSALNFGTSDNGFASPGAGTGPWVMVDFESGVYAGPNRIGVVNPGSPTITYNLVTGLSKTNGTTSWALKVGDASKGELVTAWNGALPNGYNPLRQEGGLSLGEGGDGSKLGTGAFSEGVVIAAVTSDATDNLMQANITSVYGR